MIVNSVENFYPYIKERLKYLGLNDFEIVHLVDRAGYDFRIYNKVTLNYYDIKDNPKLTVDEYLNTLFENFASSDYISDIRASHEKDIQTLKDKIKELETLNMNLSEGISNGYEYLDQLAIDDEVKNKTDRAYEELTKGLK